ncbi:MAG: hypothetical protein V9G20_22140 [Candidatus Promineifilaceae bacterium]
MKQVTYSDNRLTWFIAIGVSLIALILLGNWIGQQTRLAAQGQPPEPRPAFGDKPVAYVLPESVNIPTTTIPLLIQGSGWQEVFTETFESGISSAIWTVFDEDGVTNGEYKWGTETYTNTTPSGTRSAWSVGDGEQGGLLDPATDGYPPNAKSWLIYGPINVTEMVDGMIMFDYWFQASVGDTFAVMASTDGTNYTGLATSSGGGGNWSNVMYDLGSYAGQAQLYLAFVFNSDGTANPTNLKSVFLDQVVLAFNMQSKQYLPYVLQDPTATHTPTITPTPSATPTSSPTPTATATVGPYVDNFDFSSTGWTMRRQSTGPTSPSNGVSYVTGGRLEMSVGKSGQYEIAAPMAVAGGNTYKFETQAQFITPQDQSGYGIVFGGDWNGQTCPNSNYTSCFTSYYVLEVRWLANNNNPLLVARMREITGHDSNNNPTGTILFDWTEARLVNGVTINPNGVNEWDVQYESNGTIKVWVANQLFKTITGETSYFSQRYFGLFASTFNESGGTTNSTVVRYEYVSVVPVP